MSDGDDAAVGSAWTATTRSRLAEVKLRYDPANRFRFNHNVAV